MRDASWSLFPVPLLSALSASRNSSPSSAKAAVEEVGASLSCYADLEWIALTARRSLPSLHAPLAPRDDQLRPAAAPGQHAVRARQARLL